jgi:hypothetical protein
LFSGDTDTIKASGESTNGSLGLVEATVPPGGGPVAHAHNRTDEAFYVLSGELEILDGARTFVAGAGDFGAITWERSSKCSISAWYCADELGNPCSSNSVVAACSPPSR